MAEKSNQTVKFRHYNVDEYVPMEARCYGIREMTSVWICANANPTSWYMGTMVAVLGLSHAFLAAIIGNPLVYLILALVGIMGFRVASSTMGLTRVSFGIVGSKLPSLINVLQFVGWCGVNTWIGAIPLASLLSGFTGADPYSAGMILISVLIIMAITGVIAIYGGAKAIGIAQNIAVVCLIVLSVWITIQVFRSFPVADIIDWTLDANPANVTEPLSFGSAIDYFAAFGFAWVMAVADYTRYTRTKAAATVAPMIGAAFGMLWFCMTGAVSAIAVAVLNGGVFNPSAADLNYISSTLGMGPIASVLIVLSTISVSMINVYSGGFSMANISSKISPAKAMLIIVTGSVLLALIPLVAGSFLDIFQIFLGYLGAVFPPCIAILLVDYFLIRKKNYDISQFSSKDGPYWYRNGINPIAIGCFLLGVAGWFIGQQISFIMSWMGSVFFCFVITSAAYWSAARGFIQQKSLNRED